LTNIQTNSDIKNIITPDPYTTILLNYGREDIFFKIQKAIKLVFDVEYEMVKRGLREANIFHLMPEECDIQFEKITRDGLVFLPISRTKRYSGFAHKHEFVDKLDSNAMSYGVVAKDLETAEKFKLVQSQESTNHKTTGQYLGYPDCCSTAFEPYFRQSADPVYEVASATEGSYIDKKDGALVVPQFDTTLFVHLRYAGIRIIPWFPCNLLCKESKEKSKIWLSVLESMDQDITKFILEVLNVKNQTWDLLNAQVVITVPGYFKIIATSDYCPQRKIIKFIGD
jgi:hypothetical protein